MPELIAKPSFGICLSGGGLRAAVLASGWVRALHEVSGPGGLGVAVLHICPEKDMFTSEKDSYQDSFL
jgi:hypothetical protein